METMLEHITIVAISETNSDTYTRTVKTEDAVAVKSAIQDLLTVVPFTISYLEVEDEHWDDPQDKTNVIPSDVREVLDEFNIEY